MECREVENVAELSFDGELEAEERAALEDHLRHCLPCRRRVHDLGWIHSQVRTHLRSVSAESTPLGLRTRVSARVREEERRRRPMWTRTLPISLGLAALATLSWSSTANTTTLDPEVTVDRHAAHLPPEVHALGHERDVERFLRRNFGPGLEIPDAQRALPEIRLIGARLDHVADRRAAFLMYDHRGARVSVLVHPTEREELAAPPRFEARHVGGRPVLVGRHRGYNVLAWVRGALLYSVVADVDPHELERLVSAF
jgi:anti-sigma factor RsiW